MVEISCFVACAFGKNDVDLIFDNAIEPTLVENGILVNRVDRVEHNDDIDDKIIELIKSCEICIADLTYSRPSVYYEAGYFAGLGKPVIYTARKDHFTPKESDVSGIERIHFDLQMKNIIDWSSTEYVKTFSRRLGKRIRYVTLPIIKAKTDSLMEVEANKEFSYMSQNQRLELFVINIKNELVKKKWKKTGSGLFRYSPLITYSAFEKRNKIIVVFVTNTAIKEYLKYIKNKQIIDGQREHLHSKKECHILVVSIRQIPVSRIDDVYPENQLISEQPCTYFGGEEEKIKCYYHFISNIKSELTFRKELRIVMERIG